MLILWKYLKFVLLFCVLLCSNSTTKILLGVTFMCADTFLTTLQMSGYDISKERLNKLRMNSAIYSAIIVLVCGLSMVMSIVKKTNDGAGVGMLIIIIPAIISQVILAIVYKTRVAKLSTRADKVQRKSREIVKATAVTASNVGAGVGAGVGAVVGGTFSGAGAGLAIGFTEGNALATDIMSDQLTKIDNYDLTPAEKQVASDAVGNIYNIAQQTTNHAAGKAMDLASDLASTSFSVVREKATIMGIPIGGRSDEEVAVDILKFTPDVMLQDLPDGLNPVDKVRLLLGRK